MYIDVCNDGRRRGVVLMGLFGEHWTICCIFLYCVRFTVFVKLFVCIVSF